MYTKWKAEFASFQTIPTRLIFLKKVGNKTKAEEAEPLPISDRK